MLFTVTATSSDFTRGIEQYDAGSPEDAVSRFVEGAGSMADYDRAEWLARRSDRLGLIHVAEVRGVWIWWSHVDFVHDDVAMYGGLVVQTDAAAPVRPAAG
jgi:hypothetical protein